MEFRLFRVNSKCLLTLFLVLTMFLSFKQLCCGELLEYEDWNTVNVYRPLPIIFVHGMNSGPDKWNTAISALTGEFSKYYDGGSWTHLETFNYKYNTFDPINWNAYDGYLGTGLQFPDSHIPPGEDRPTLKNYVTGILGKYDNVDKCIIVAHSLGAPVSRYYINRSSGQYVEKLITLGGVHLGTKFAELGTVVLKSPIDRKASLLARLFAKNIPTDREPYMIDEMCPNSDFLADLNSNIPSIDYYCLAGTFANPREYTTNFYRDLNDGFIELTSQWAVVGGTISEPYTWDYQPNSILGGRAEILKVNYEDEWEDQPELSSYPYNETNTWWVHCQHSAEPDQWEHILRALDFTPPQTTLIKVIENEGEANEIVHNLPEDPVNVGIDSTITVEGMVEDEYLPASSWVEFEIYEIIDEQTGDSELVWSKGQTYLRPYENQVPASAGFKEDIGLPEESGKYVLHVFTYDSAGNVSNIFTRIWVCWDNVPPEITDVTIKNELGVEFLTDENDVYTVWGTTVTIEVDVTDTGSECFSGIDKVVFFIEDDAGDTYYLNGTTDIPTQDDHDEPIGGTYTISWNTDTFEPGEYTLHILAYDQAGNVNNIMQAFILSQLPSSGTGTYVGWWNGDFAFTWTRNHFSTPVTPKLYKHPDYSPQEIPELSTPYGNYLRGTQRQWHEQGEFSFYNTYYVSGGTFIYIPPVNPDWTSPSDWEQWGSYIPTYTDRNHPSASAVLYRLNHDEHYHLGVKYYYYNGANCVSNFVVLDKEWDYSYCEYPKYISAFMWGDDIYILMGSFSGPSQAFFRNDHLIYFSCTPSLYFYNKRYVSFHVGYEHFLGFAGQRGDYFYWAWWDGNFYTPIYFTRFNSSGAVEEYTEIPYEDISGYPYNNIYICDNGDILLLNSSRTSWFSNGGWHFYNHETVNFCGTDKILRFPGEETIWNYFGDTYGNISNIQGVLSSYLPAGTTADSKFVYIVDQTNTSPTISKRFIWTFHPDAPNSWTLVKVIDY